MEDQLLQLLCDHGLLDGAGMARVERRMTAAAMAPGRALAEERLLDESRLYQIIQRDLGMNSPLQTVYRTYTICGQTLPRFKVSGDFYGYFWLDEGRLAITLSDVSGKGLEAGLLALLLGNLLRQSVRMKNVIPSVIMRKINQASASFFGVEQFATFTVLIVDMHSGTAEFSSAGTPPMLFYRHRERSIEEIDMRNIPVGIDENWMYSGRRTDINKGDVILLFTDGAYEAQNFSNEYYGIERIKNTLHAGSKGDARQVLSRQRRALRWFSLLRGLNDDTTYVAIKRS
ncbi:MAG: SpoIIE family protein phosphatase [Leptospirales bacterium]|nr:SpoIIE family protein phosphatase [Leptospirales bacterium]